MRLGAVMVWLLCQSRTGARALVGGTTVAAVIGAAGHPLALAYVTAYLLVAPTAAGLIVFMGQRLMGASQREARATSVQILRVLYLLGDGPRQPARVVGSQADRHATKQAPEGS